jgi:hypothetical protein
VLLYLIMAFEGYLFGLFFGVVCKNETIAVNLMPMAMIPMLIFGGLAVNINDIPVYIRWCQYLTPLRHSFLIMFQDQMDSARFAHFSGLDLPEKFGVGGDVTISWICLLGLMLAYLLLAIVLLLLHKRKE